MNGNPQSNSTEAPPNAPRRPVVNSVLFLAMAVTAAIIGYTIFVAVNEPDPQETIVLGQTKIADGGPAGLRILVRNRISGKPISDAQVELTLTGGAGGARKLGVFRTDALGTVTNSIDIPELAPGEYQLTVDTSSSLGRDHVVEKIEIQHPVRVLLSSDKPIYQPGQTVHLRSLILNGRTEKPFANLPVTFEITDPKGNKVFKEPHTTSPFGITSADFVLATELNLGRYQIRALAGADSAEQAVEVKPYVLPKLKIHVTTGKASYHPGEIVTGSVEADYFFGKPAAGATVKLTASTFQEKPVVISETDGRADTAGRFSFRFQLPAFFAGLPQKNQAAFLDLTASVCDSAGHTEEKVLSLSVAENDLEITAIPEAGTFVPGVENILYVLTAYPDGRPAPCKVFLDGTSYQTDTQGLCEIKLTPIDAAKQYEIKTLDAVGGRGSLKYQPLADRPAPAFLLRADKAIYNAGQTARITVLSPDQNNTVFIDVIKDGQTVATRSVALVDHKADYALPLPPGLVGTLQLHAYLITENGEDRGCSRIICVNPASGLQIAAKLSQPVFRPGQAARMDFSVTDAQGKPAPAALGIAAVDESVFALSENRPGLLQQFLDAESDLGKPRYQIKFFDSPLQLFETGNQSLAAARFASLETPRTMPDINELMNNDPSARRVIEHARGLRGTPYYERLRSDPQYASVIRLLENTDGTYSLRQATGAVKLQSAQAQRDRYFRALKEYLKIGFLTLIFLSPILLIIYHLRANIKIQPGAQLDSATARYIKFAGSFHSVMASLVLLPLVCYPIGAIALEHAGNDANAWTLLGFELTVVLITVVILDLKTTSPENQSPEIARFRIFIGIFFVQYFVSRASFVLLCCSVNDPGPLLLLWGFASITAPLIVLGCLSSHIQRQLALKGVAAKVTNTTVIEVLVVIAIVFILGGLMLPALAKAKAKAISINLINDLKQIELANRLAEEDRPAGSPSNGSQPPRVRRDFPETLFWQPELITDDQGNASVEIPLADSITTWRTSIDAINSAGRMGSTSLPIPVFQDFFVDLDLPVSLSLGDQVSIPVTCYNYLKEPQDVRFTIAGASWFESPIQNSSLHLGPNEVKSFSLPLKVLRVGNHSLRVTATGAKTADAVEREIRVVPTGDRFDFSTNAVLNGDFTDTFTIPAGAVPDSQSLSVRFYPSRFSEVVEGLDGVLRAPYGCFEQTSSTTYPNVLVLDYMKRTGHLTPEVEIRARKFINAGYQRLLTFEVPGGGFDWFGHIPANICLTAYGILEFTDMARVHPVDTAVTQRARQWLFAQQNSDGSWDEIHRGWTWAGRGSMTAFVAWALAESGDRSAALDKALNYLRNHPAELANMYATALAANAFLAHDVNDTFGRGLASQIRKAATADPDKTVHWSSAGASVTFSHGSGYDVETTSLAALALMKAGESPQTVRQALTWISAQKNPAGGWESTQSTILAMRALLAGSSTSLGQEFESTITVLLNDKPVETFRVNKDNSDVMKQIELTGRLAAGANRIQFRQSPSGELPFTLSGAYWMPALPKSAPVTNAEPLQIVLQYDHSTLAVDDLLHCAVTVRNNTGQAVSMAIIDLGIPPGFDVDTAAFDDLQSHDRIAKYEVTGNQAILYFRELSETTPLQFSYSLRAKYPLRVQTPPSAVYEYYQPRNRAESKPVILETVAK